MPRTARKVTGQVLLQSLLTRSKEGNKARGASWRWKHRSWCQVYTCDSMSWLDWPHILVVLALRQVIKRCKSTGNNTLARKSRAGPAAAFLFITQIQKGFPVQYFHNYNTLMCSHVHGQDSLSSAIIRYSTVSSSMSLPIFVIHFKAFWTSVVSRSECQLSCCLAWTSTTCEGRKTWRRAPSPTHKNESIILDPSGW